MSTTRPSGMNAGITNAIVQAPLKMLLTLATETWRIRRKLCRVSEQEAPDEAAGLIVSAERMNSCFQQMGIECKGYDGLAYDEGLNVTVLDYEERDDLTPGSATIMKTVTPAIFVQGNLIRPAEVVVARAAVGKEETDGAEHS